MTQSSAINFNSANPFTIQKSSGYHPLIEHKGMMTVIAKLYIVAGTLKEAAQFANSHQVPKRRWVYINTVEKVFQHSAKDGLFIFVGSWFELKDSTKIKSIATSLERSIP